MQNSSPTSAYLVRCFWHDGDQTFDEVMNSNPERVCEALDAEGIVDFQVIYLEFDVGTGAFEAAREVTEKFKHLREPTDEEQVEMDAESANWEEHIRFERMRLHLV